MVVLLVIAMAPWRGGIPGAMNETFGRGRASHGQDMKEGQDPMRLFYLIVTLLLLFSLGLLEVVAARGVSMTALGP
jgi:hypothetical protein